jgi:hypothetical protein
MNSNSGVTGAAASWRRISSIPRARMLRSVGASPLATRSMTVEYQDGSQ